MGDAKQVLDQGQAAAIGQRQIQGHQVRAFLPHRFDGIVGAPAFGHDLEIRLHLDEPFETFPDNGVVVDQNDAVHTAMYSTPRRPRTPLPDM
ncbi:hypothetical protein DYGSA30_34700 [Dyella sp. GSA-30]|nr:hypothetical protein DYGSA30_34700 [Dyella sp. GSA-30]